MLYQLQKRPQHKIKQKLCMKSYKDIKCSPYTAHNKLIHPLNASNNNDSTHTYARTRTQARNGTREDIHTFTTAITYTRGEHMILSFYSFFIFYSITLLIPYYIMFPSSAVVLRHSQTNITYHIESNYLNTQWNRFPVIITDDSTIPYTYMYVYE